MRIFAFDAGLSYHKVALEGRYRQHVAATGYLRDQAAAGFAEHDALLVPCRTPAALVLPWKERIHAFLEEGGTVVAMGETEPERWLPGIRREPRPTNYWWWLEPGGELGLRIAAPNHPLFAWLGEDAIAWHIHGVLEPPPGAVSLIETEAGESLLYEDRASTPGRILVTTLDPFFHHGTHFMPATTRFLDGFMAWLAAAPSLK